MKRSTVSKPYQDTSVTPATNGHSNENHDLIDDDIQHTVDRLFQVRPQQNNLTKGRKENLEEIVQHALQAERNHWKQRLHMSMQEIDRQHKATLAIQSGLQVMYRTGYINLQKQIFSEC